MNTLIQLEDWAMRWIGFDPTDRFNRWVSRLWIFYSAILGGYLLVTSIVGQAPSGRFGSPFEIALLIVLVPLILVGLFAYWRNRRKQLK